VDQGKQIEVDLTRRIGEKKTQNRGKTTANLARESSYKNGWLHGNQPEKARM